MVRERNVTDTDSEALMTQHTPAPAKLNWSSAQWLSLLLLGAIAAAGWVQLWKSQKLAQSALERSNTDPKQTAMDSNPTLSLMQDVDLIRQNELLSEENHRLSRELKQLQEQADEASERTAIDDSDKNLP